VLLLFNGNLGILDYIPCWARLEFELIGFNVTEGGFPILFYCILAAAFPW